MDIVLITYTTPMNLRRRGRTEFACQECVATTAQWLTSIWIGDATRVFVPSIRPAPAKVESSRIKWGLAFFVSATPPALSCSFTPQP